MKPLKLIAFVVLTILVVCCDAKYESVRPQNVLYLRHKGADMSIYIQGNLASQTIILFLHGGPGSDAILAEHWFKGLSKQYAVALWEQRAAGSSSGKVDKSTLTYEQFGEDCRYVVDLLKQKYPQSNIFLMGHSYGVELGWQFLTTKNWQNKVSGYIAINGAHSGFSYYYYQHQWLLREAQAQNNSEIYQWAKEHPVTRASLAAYDGHKAYDYMTQLKGDESNVITPGLILQKTFFSPVSLGGNLINSQQFQANDDYNRQFKVFDRSAQLGSLRMPVALFWGVRDGNVTIEVGRQADSLLINSPKRLVMFEASWHTPQETENERFTSEVIDFIETYK